MLDMLKYVLGNVITHIKSPLNLSGDYKAEGINIHICDYTTHKRTKVNKRINEYKNKMKDMENLYGEIIYKKIIRQFITNQYDSTLTTLPPTLETEGSLVFNIDHFVRYATEFATLHFFVYPLLFFTYARLPILNTAAITNSDVRKLEYSWIKNKVVTDAILNSRTGLLHYYRIDHQIESSLADFLKVNLLTSQYSINTFNKKALRNPETFDTLKNQLEPLSSRKIFWTENSSGYWVNHREMYALATIYQDIDAQSNIATNIIKMLIRCKTTEAENRIIESIAFINKQK
jgi:hypothetical protein